MTALRMMTLSLITLSFAACVAAEQPVETSDPPAPADELLDSQRPIPSDKAAPTVSNLGAPGEIAFGTIDTGGTRITGTSNWTSVLNAALQRYEVTITGESYFFSRYATTVTSMGGSQFCMTDSLGGKLIIRCVNAAGTAVTPFVGFVVFKP